jgi:hypothetical protein
MLRLLHVKTLTTTALEHYLPREWIKRSLFQKTSNIATTYTWNDDVAPVEVIMDAVAHFVFYNISIQVVLPANKR